MSRIENFNSQPREGGWQFIQNDVGRRYNFNSQPREGGWTNWHQTGIGALYFNSQPREGGWLDKHCAVLTAKIFQLTAARRRLALKVYFAGIIQHFNSQPREGGWAILCEQRYYRAISTHSRAKAAGLSLSTISQLC